MGMAHACATLTALLTLILCCHLAVAQSSSPCESIPVEKIDGPAVPDFPEQYSMHVEANIIQANKTIEAREFYDFPGSRASISFSSQGRSWTYVLNFNTSERYDIATNGTCQTRSLNDVGKNVFGFLAFDGKGHVRLASVTDVMKFGGQFNETYLGPTQVRGIAVDHWVSCVTMSVPKAVMRLDYYFTQEARRWPGGTFYIPVRATVQGLADNVDDHGRHVQGQHSFSHSYEFTDFRPGPVLDLSVFETPRGVVCRDRKATSRFPPLPDQMTIDLEINHGPGSRPTGEKVYFDLSAKLARRDIRQAGQHEPTTSRIQDFSTGVEYEVDFESANCSITTLQRSSFGHVDERGRVTMNHVTEILNMADRQFIYQGERRWRGLLVDAWANETANGVVFEVYFLKDSPPPRGEMPPIPGLHRDPTSGLWRVAPSAGPGKAVPVGVYLFNRTAVLKGGSQPTEKYVHMFNFDSSHPDYDVFDIGLCYSQQSSKLSLRFHVEGSYDDYVRGYSAQFHTAVRAAISKAARVTPLRVSQLLVTQSSDAPGEIIVFFSILDNPSLPGGQTGVSRGPTLVQARASLLAAVSSGLVFPLHLPSRSLILGVKLDSVAITTHPEDRITTKSITSYSPGAMAGLGIGMGLLGALLGLLGAFLVYRRVQPDLSIPYMRDH